MRASEVAAIVGGTLVGPDAEIAHVAIDSRVIAPGDLFVPVLGERDGHEFIADALERGAAAYFTDQQPVEGTAIVVHNPVAALRELAGDVRARTVVGITGSVGKTSTKDLTAA